MIFSLLSLVLLMRGLIVRVNQITSIPIACEGFSDGLRDTSSAADKELPSFSSSLFILNIHSCIVVINEVTGAKVFPHFSQSKCCSLTARPSTQPLIGPHQGAASGLLQNCGRNLYVDASIDPNGTRDKGVLSGRGGISASLLDFLSVSRWHELNDRKRKYWL